MAGAHYWPCSRYSLTSILAAFALYIHCTAKPGFVDPITLSEAWDYLRDVLLLTLRDRHFFEKLDPLAVLLPASICSALTSLLACMRQNTGTSAVSEIVHSSD